MYVYIEIMYLYYICHNYNTFQFIKGSTEAQPLKKWFANNRGVIDFLVKLGKSELSPMTLVEICR